jgi:hypothetical protein
MTTNNSNSTNTRLQHQESNASEEAGTETSAADASAADGVDATAAAADPSSTDSSSSSSNASSSSDGGETGPPQQPGAAASDLESSCQTDCGAASAGNDSPSPGCDIVSPSACPADATAPCGSSEASAAAPAASCGALSPAAAPAATAMAAAPAAPAAAAAAAAKPPAAAAPPMLLWGPAVRQGAYKEMDRVRPSALLAAAGSCKKAGTGGQGRVKLVTLPGSGARVAVKRLLQPVRLADFQQELTLWGTWAGECPHYVMPLLAAEFEPCSSGSGSGSSSGGGAAAAIDRTTAGAKLGRALMAMGTTRGNRKPCTLELAIARHAKLLRRARRGSSGGGGDEAGAQAAAVAAATAAHNAYARRVLAALLVALDAAHGLGIAWLDLKPHNVLVEEDDGAPWVIDFGMARAVGRRGLEAAPAGTHGYVAPEMLARRRYGRIGTPADMWALGVAALALHAGEDRHSWHDLVDEDGVLRADAAAAAGLPPGAPPALRDLIFRRLLEPAPGRRATARQAMGHPYFEGLDWDALHAGRFGEA